MAQAWIVGIVFLLFCLAMFAVTLRIGPKRRSWAQPAAKFGEPGMLLKSLMIVVGVAHAVLAVFASITLTFDGAWRIAAVGIVMGMFYVACAFASTLGKRTRLIARIHPLKS